MHVTSSIAASGAPDIHVPIDAAQLARKTRFASIAEIAVPLHLGRMTYRQQSERNWGVLVSCLIAVPIAFAWAAMVFVGGSLVCADAAAHCDGMLWPLVKGIALIAAGATVMARAINLAIRAFARAR